MNDEQILKVLLDFDEYMTIGNPANYIFKLLGWWLIKGLALLVDSLEKITDSVLLTKLFFENKEIQSFVTTIRPVLWVLLALSFAYIGYLIIMNKKSNRSQIITNLIFSVTILCVLGTTMTQMNKFTDDAIKVVKQENKGTLSDKVIKDNLIDVAQYDAEGWKSPKLKTNNNIAEKNIRKIDITEKIDKDFEFSKDKKLGDDGKKIFDKKAETMGDGTPALRDLKNGWFDFFPEAYYRWSWNYWNMFLTLLVTGVTLALVSIKIARLGFELAFNYILATILAPADVAHGQKLKAVVSQIINSFLVMIMIFLSLKLYMIGTAYIHDKLDGVPYIIALIAFSFAVIDGPVMCERIFGIDAGLKSSWATAAAVLGGAKAAKAGASALANGLGKMGNGAAMAGAAAAGMAMGGKNSEANNGGGEKETLQEEMNKKGKGLTDDSSQTAHSEEGGTDSGVSSLQQEMAANSVSKGKEEAAATLQDQMKQTKAGKGENAKGQGKEGNPQGIASKKKGPASVQNTGVGTHAIAGEGSEAASVQDGPESVQNTGVGTHTTSGEGTGVASVQDGPESVQNTGVGTHTTSGEGTGVASVQDGPESVQTTGPGTHTTPGNGTGVASVQTTGVTTQQAGVGQQQVIAQQQAGVGQQQVIAQQQAGVGQQQVIAQQQAGAGQQQVIAQQQAGAGQQQVIAQQQAGAGQQQVIAQQQAGPAQQTVVQPGASGPAQQTVVQPGASGPAQQTVVQPGASGPAQQTVVQPGASGPAQQTVVQPGASGPAQQTVVQPGASGPAQQTVVQPGASGPAQQTVVHQGTNGTTQQTVVHQGTNGTTQQTVVHQGTNGTTQQTVVHQSGNGQSQQPFQENRTIGQIFSDKFSNGQFARKLKQSYQAGKNTRRSWQDIAGKKTSGNDDMKNNEE